MKRLIRKKANAHGFDADVVCALIWHESRGNPWAARVEPGFFDRYIKNAPAATLPGYFPNFPPSEATERWARSTSWGLMQIMGNTARLIGYKKRDLTRLLIPAINLEYGCLYLAQCFSKATGEGKERLCAALAAYNTGRANAAATLYDETILKILDVGDFNQMFE